MHDAEQAAPPKDRARRVLPWALGLVTLACCLRLASFVARFAVDLPFADQWDYLNPLFEERSPLGSFLYQHGPHKLGLGGLLDRVLYPAGSWDVRLASWSCALLLVLSAALAFALVGRIRGRLLWRDLLIPLAFINPLHWEGILLTPGATASFLPLFLLLLSAHAWLLRDALQRGLALGALLSLSLYTGYGFCHAIAGAALLALDALAGDRPSRLRLLPGLTLLASAFAWFLHTQVWSPAVAGWSFPVPDWWNYPTFVILLHGRLLGSDYFSVTAFLTGSAMTVALLCCLLRGVPEALRGERKAAVWCVLWLALCSLAYAGFVAVGRLPTGLQAAFLWRYSTLLLPGLVALLLLEALVPTLQPRLARLFSVVLVLAGLRMWCDFSPERFGSINLKGKTDWIRSYLRHHDLARANAESDCVVYPPSPQSPDLSSKLDWLEQRHLSFFAHPGDFLGSEAVQPAKGDATEGK